MVTFRLTGYHDQDGSIELAREPVPADFGCTDDEWRDSIDRVRSRLMALGQLAIQEDDHLLAVTLWCDQTVGRTAVNDRRVWEIPIGYQDVQDHLRYDPCYD